MLERLHCLVWDNYSLLQEQRPTHTENSSDRGNTSFLLCLLLCVLVLLEKTNVHTHFSFLVSWALNSSKRLSSSVFSWPKRAISSFSLFTPCIDWRKQKALVELMQQEYSSVTSDWTNVHLPNAFTSHTHQEKVKTPPQQKNIHQKTGNTSQSYFNTDTSRTEKSPPPPTK